MFELNDIENWEKLSNPYGNSEEVPVLLDKLSKAPSEEIIDEICWELIYHQETLYEVTFVTIPYLIGISVQLGMELKTNLLLNIGAILSNYSEEYYKKIFKNSKFNADTVTRIKNNFDASLEHLKNITYSEFDEIKEQVSETDKRYFFVLLAVADKKYRLGYVLDHAFDECCCICPYCDTEIYISADKELTVLDNRELNSKNYPINKPEIGKFKNKDTEKEYIWLTEKIKQTGADENTWEYLFGEIACPNCNRQYNIFEHIG